MSSPSPSMRVCSREGMPKRRPIEIAATASGGARTAPSARAAAHGRSGDDEVGHAADGERAHRDQRHREQGDGPRVRAEVDEAGVQRRAVEQRRQDEDEDHLGVERERRSPATGEQARPPSTSSTGRRHAGAAGDQAGQADAEPDREHRRERRLDPVHRPPRRATTAARLGERHGSPVPVACGRLGARPVEQPREHDDAAGVVDVVLVADPLDRPLELAGCRSPACAAGRRPSPDTVQAPTTSGTRSRLRRRSRGRHRALAVDLDVGLRRPAQHLAGRPPP